MTHIARHFGAALICAFLWLSVSTAQAAVCALLFEVIPSKDTAAIIGGEVTARLASKNFAQWRGFSERQAAVVDDFLETNFGNVAKFDIPTVGIGGFEGNSSPSIVITVHFEKDFGGDILGNAINKMASAIGYTFIQDGTVALCNTSVGKFGGKHSLYSISPGEGFELGTSEGFVKTAYSAIVDANDDSSIGYIFDEDEMYILDLTDGHLPEILDTANKYLAALFTAGVSIRFDFESDLQSIYRGNNWVEDPTGSSLLEYVSKDLYASVWIAQKAYIEDLKEFSSMN